MFVFVFIFLLLWFVGSHVLEATPASWQIGGALICALLSFVAARSSYRSSLKRTGHRRQ
jgi:hypothetical protein